MLYLKTLATISPNELQAVGQRGQDLAFLASHQLPTAPSFVVLSNAYDEIIRQNNLKYKFDYIMSHAQENIHSSLVNTYSGVRKALLEAKFPPGLETELHDLYQQISSPVAIGELTTERLPVRIILSMNRIDDSENNDTIIQNINSLQELLVAVREAYALVHHPSALGVRMREKFADNRLKVALIIQAMEEPLASCHTYSSLPQDHKKVYLQAYYGYLDVREKITKDYYAVSKETLRIVASQIRDQPAMLERDAQRELVATPLSKGKVDKINDRELVELARLTKKVERVLQTPVKIFFTSKNDAHEVLWVNRLGFDVLLDDDVIIETPKVEEVKAEPLAQVVIEQQEDFIIQEEKTPLPVQHGVAAKLLQASLRIVRQVVERKYRSTFGETDALGNIADMVNRLNSANVFSRTVDGPLLLQAEEAAKQESTISEGEYAKTIEEVAYLMGYA